MRYELDTWQDHESTNLSKKETQLTTLIDQLELYVKRTYLGFGCDDVEQGADWQEQNMQNDE